MMEQRFRAEIGIIGINPFVSLPAAVLASIFEQSGIRKSPIPVHGTINQKRFKQTLVKYQGVWRLYINLTMLQNSPKRIGEEVEVTIAYDPIPRTHTAHPELTKALANNQPAKDVFDSITPSLRKEIIKYINNLKTEESIKKNVGKAILFLLGQGRFVGRDSI